MSEVRRLRHLGCLFAISTILSWIAGCGSSAMPCPAPMIRVGVACFPCIGDDMHSCGLADGSVVGANDITDINSDTRERGASCGAGQTMCGDECVDLSNALANCGHCGNVCPLPANGSASCTDSVCGLAMCTAGFANCDRAPVNGCEVRLAMDIAHCGMCGNRCPAPMMGTATCGMAMCGMICDVGSRALNGRCIGDGVFPRQIAPISLGDVTLRRPTLRYHLPPEFGGAVVELCLDRACTRMIERIRSPSNSARPTNALAANSVVFWRIRGTSGAQEDSVTSPTWLFHVPARDASAGVDSSSNAHLDVNGDGFDDVAIGASGASPGGRRFAGTVSVYLGDLAGVSAVRARVLEGAEADDGFGSSVASAGDVNGDGFAELVVGAQAADRGGRPNSGTVSVFMGSVVGISMMPDRVLEGVGFNDAFGYSVASAGDVDGDGFADLVVGACGAAPGGRFTAGAVSVFMGSVVGISMMPDRVLEGVARMDNFGVSVASAGDVNGDGFSDLVVGANLGSAEGRIAVGTVSVFVGSPMGISVLPARVLDGASVGGSFGWSVASAGDVNGDGFSDLVVGANHGSIGGRIDVGTASVFEGSPVGISMLPVRVLEGVARGDNYGNSVASAGDLNGDGFGDLVVGAHRASLVGRNNAGTASVFMGSAMGISMLPVRVLEGVATDDFFGCSVARAGDVNGDGFGDLVVGAYRAPAGGQPIVGTVGVFVGSAVGISMQPVLVLEGASAGDAFGRSVASAVDASEDGFGGLVVRWMAARAVRERRRSARERVFPWFLL